MVGCPIQSTCAKCKNSKGLGGVPGQSHRWGSRGEPRWCSYVFCLFVCFVFCFFFNAETEFQCKLICSLDDDHVHLKTMMRPRGYSSMIGYRRAADTWKVDPFLYQILPNNETMFIPVFALNRGHRYTRRLILRPISAARPRIDLCTKNPPPRDEARIRL